MTIRNLKYMFKPRSIAIIGRGREEESPDAILEINLIKAGFTGPVMPVNPDRRAVSSVLAYQDIASLPERPDLAIITRPLDECPSLISELGERGTRGVVLVSEEVLKTRPDQGAALKQALLDAAKPHVLRFVGPNRLGIAIPSHRVNGTLSHNTINPGSIGMLSESSTVLRAVMYWAERRKIGFSHLVSLGARVDVDFSDMLDYLAQDHETRSILMYMERTRNPRKFMSAARIAARIKPVIVLKPRNYGSVEDAIYDAAFRRAGLLRVDTIERLFNSVETLASAKPVRKNRLIIVGNSRSLGLLAGDMLLRKGGVMAEISSDTQAELARIIHHPFHADNPIDLGDRAAYQEYDKTLELLLKEPDIDGILVVHVPASPDHDEKCARAIVERAAKSRRLVLTSWVAAPSTAPARQLLREAGIASYSTPDEAARSFMRVAEYYQNQTLLMETPPSVPEEFKPDLETARGIVATVLAAGRVRLNGREVNALLTAYGIPTPVTRFASSPQEAADLAVELKFPVAVKIISPDIAERAEIGGVALALGSPEEVYSAASAMLRRLQCLVPQAFIEGFAVQPMLTRHGAYELTIGVRTGRHFGGSPMVLFGQGGTEAQVINDFAYALLPLSMHLAHELMSRTRIFSLMSNSPGRPADLNALALTLIKVSQMVIDLGELAEMDINPLWVRASDVLALNASVWIAETQASGTDRLAIRPYPKELEQALELPDGRKLLIRPIRPEDEPELQEMVRRMPPEDIRLRFFRPIKVLTHDMAARLTQLDYDREMALVLTDPDLAGKATIWGVVHISADPDMERAEYAIALDRAMIGLGLGPMLMRRMIEYARNRGIGELYGDVLRENEPMLKLNRAMGFTLKNDPEDPNLLHVSLSLR
jgi:acetyltransferase